MFAIPVIHYCLALLVNIVSKVDRNFWKVLTIHGAHHLKSNVDWLYLLRHLGGRGFISIAAEFEKRPFVS